MAATPKLSREVNAIHKDNLIKAHNRKWIAEGRKEARENPNIDPKWGPRYHKPTEEGPARVTEQAVTTSIAANLKAATESRPDWFRTKASVEYKEHSSSEEDPSATSDLEGASSASEFGHGTSSKPMRDRRTTRAMDPRKPLVRDQRSSRRLDVKYAEFDGEEGESEEDHSATSESEAASSYAAPKNRMSSNPLGRRRRTVHITGQRSLGRRHVDEAESDSREEEDSEEDQSATSGSKAASDADFEPRTSLRSNNTRRDGRKARLQNKASYAEASGTDVEELEDRPATPALRASLREQSHEVNYVAPGSADDENLENGPATNIPASGGAARRDVSNRVTTADPTESRKRQPEDKSEDDAGSEVHRLQGSIEGRPAPHKRSRRSHQGIEMANVRALEPRVVSQPSASSRSTLSAPFRPLNFFELSGDQHTFVKERPDEVLSNIPTSSTVTTAKTDTGSQNASTRRIGIAGGLHQWDQYSLADSSPSALLIPFEAEAARVHTVDVASVGSGPTPSGTASIEAGASRDETFASTALVSAKQSSNGSFSVMSIRNLLN